MSAEQITPISGPYKGKTGELILRYDDGSADVRYYDVDCLCDFGPDVAAGDVHPDDARKLCETAVNVPREDMPPTFDAYAWPGGYPIAYYTDGGDVLCPACAKSAGELAMSDTHRANDRYCIFRPAIMGDRVYMVVDRETDKPVNNHGMTRTAALNCCSRLNGRDMYPDHAEEENRNV